MKKLFYLLFILLFIFNPIFISLLFAAPAPTATPIDGGVSILLGLGLFYGISRLFKSRKRIE